MPSPSTKKPAADRRLVEALDGCRRGCSSASPLNVLDDELVEREVEVECADHVVAIAKCVGDLVVELMAGRFGITHQVEPVPGPSLAVVRAGQERVDQLFVGVGVLIVQERLDVLGLRGKAGQVERKTADQGTPAGLGRGGQVLLLRARPG